MTHFGKIKSYDSKVGSGMILPDEGGDPLVFATAELDPEGRQPEVGQRYGYQTEQVDGSKAYAVNLRMQQIYPEAHRQS